MSNEATFRRVASSAFASTAVIAAFAGCGGDQSHASTTSTRQATATTTPQASHHYSAAAKAACQQFEQAASSIPQNNYSAVTLSDFTQYSQAVQRLTQTLYGPGSSQVLTAQKDVLSLPAVGAVSDQQLAMVDHDAASLGTLCGQVLSS